MGDSTTQNTLAPHRRALRAFRDASAERAKLEHDLSERLAADVSELERLVVEAREAEAQVMQAAASVGVVHKGQSESFSMAALQDGDSGQELARSVTAATEAAAEVKAASRDLQQHRRAAAGRRLAIRAAVVVGILMVLAVSFVGYRLWDTGRLYQASLESMNASRWDDARRDLQQLLSTDANYKDARAHLQETYVRSAVQALEAGEWDKAQATLQHLPGGGVYKDAPAVLRDSYYRAAVAALRSGQIDKAADLVVLLSKVDPAYKDIPDIVASNADLRHAVAARYSGQWIKGVATGPRALAGEDTSVRAVFFSPDGRMLLTAGSAKVASLWDIASGKVVRTFPIPAGYHDAVVVYRNGVALSPDGKLLATPDGERGVSLWDVQSGKPVRALTGANVSPWAAMAFSPDGKTLVASYYSGSGQATLYDMKSLMMWNVETGQQTVTVPPGGELLINSLAFSPDGRTLATGGLNFKDPASPVIVLRDTVTGRDVGSMKSEYVWAVAFSRDGAHLAACTEPAGFELWDVATRTVRWTSRRGRGCHGATFSPGGNLVASGYTVPDASNESYPYRGAVDLWNYADGQLVRTLDIQKAGEIITNVSFSSDASMMAASGNSGAIYLWSVR